MRWLLVFICVFGLMLSASAEVPQQVHYNGYLTNAVGEAVDCPDPVQCVDTFSIRFRLYSSEDGGSAIWEEEYSNVPVYMGSFHAILGTVTPISAEIIDGPTWLAIKINEHEEMYPRQKVASSAYAIRAGHAESSLEATNASQLGGVDASDYATAASVTELETNLSVVATEGLPADLADGDQDTLGTLVCAEGMVPKMSGTGEWTCGTDIDTDTDTTIADTTLDEATVDLMVSNNGYAADSSVATLQNDLTLLQNALETAETNLTNLQASLNTLSTDTGAGIASTQADISALQGLVSQLQINVNSFEDLVAAVKVDLDNETATRVAADTTLQTNIDAESTTRSSKDLVLQNSLDSLQTQLDSAPVGQWLPKAGRIEASNAPSVVISDTGRLGVGTATPNNFKLEVIGDGAAPGHVALFMSDESYSYVGVASTEQSIYLGVDNAGTFRIHEPGVGDRMTIDSSGSVGIGTSIPAKTLEVKAGGSGNGINLISHANANAVVQLESGTAGGYLQLHDKFNDQKVRLDSTSDSWINGGNVGIGTATPTQKLTVAGTIEMTSGGVKFPDGSVQTTAAAASPVAGSSFYLSAWLSCPFGWSGIYAGPVTGTGDMQVCYRTDKQCASFYVRCGNACPGGWAETGCVAGVFSNGDNKVCYRCP
jgi:hypothetical protein